MKYFSLYYSFLRLKASNKNLIKFYYSLFDKVEGEEEILQKEFLSAHIAYRERFEVDFSRLSRYFINRRSSLFEIAAGALFRQITGIEYGVKRNVLSITWDSCYTLEQENIKLYYQLLYTEEMTKPITDILLEQKGIVENRIIREIF